MVILGKKMLFLFNLIELSPLLNVVLNETINRQFVLGILLPHFLTLLVNFSTLAVQHFNQLNRSEFLQTLIVYLHLICQFQLHLVIFFHFLLMSLHPLRDFIELRNIYFRLIIYVFLYLVYPFFELRQLWLL